MTMSEDTRKDAARSGERNGSAADSALLVKIRALYDSLSGTEKKAADYVLKHPREVIYLSITGLAENCGVSDASVVRLCKRLGMQGYQELKVTLAQDMVSPLEQIHESVQATDTPIQILEKVFQTTIQALQYTSRVVSAAQLDRAVEALNAARRVNIYGLGNSASVCADLQHKLLRLGIDAAAYTDSHMQCIASTYLGAGDVCVGISHSGSSRDVVDAVRIARDRGATILCMTGVGRSPLSELSTIRLDTASSETQFHIIALSSRIAQYAMIDSLYTALALKRQKALSDPMRSIERALEKKKY